MGSGQRRHAEDVLGRVPANADAALSGNILLFDPHLRQPRIQRSGGRREERQRHRAGPNAAATGVATFWRAFNGAAVVAQGTVGTSGESLDLGTTNINAGDVVQVSSFVVTEAP